MLEESLKTYRKSVIVAQSPVDGRVWEIVGKEAGDLHHNLAELFFRYIAELLSPVVDDVTAHNDKVQLEF